MRTLLSILLIMACLTVYAQEESKPVKDTTALKLKLKEMNQKINSIESNFVQEKYLSVMSEKIISKGYFCFKKENKLRWEFSEPFEYMIVIDGEKMYIKDEDKVTKYDIESNKMFREINKMMIGMVKGDILGSKDFIVSYAENDKHYDLTLNPGKKEMKEFINSILISVNKSDFSVDEIMIRDGSEDYTRIVFKDKKLNNPVPDEKFIVK